MSQRTLILSMEFTDLVSHPRQRSESDDFVQVSAKLSSTGITLIPQPSDDVKDPLVRNRVTYSTSGCTAS